MFGGVGGEMVGTEEGGAGEREVAEEEAAEGEEEMGQVGVEGWWGRIPSWGLALVSDIVVNEGGGELGSY